LGSGSTTSHLPNHSLTHSLTSGRHTHSLVMVPGRSPIDRQIAEIYPRDRYRSRHLPACLPACPSKPRSVGHQIRPSHRVTAKHHRDSSDQNRPGEKGTFHPTHHFTSLIRASDRDIPGRPSTRHTRRSRTTLGYTITLVQGQALTARHTASPRLTPSVLLHIPARFKLQVVTGTSPSDPRDHGRQGRFVGSSTGLYGSI